MQRTHQCCHTQRGTHASVALVGLVFFVVSVVLVVLVFFVVGVVSVVLVFLVVFRVVRMVVGTTVVIVRVR